jgi:uncharacterized membrane protein SirB2
MITHAAVRHLHMGAAAVSLLLFALRGGWMLVSPAQLQRRWVRVAPHVVDTLLLASALWLAWRIGPAPWIVAKVVAVLVYIALGTVALKRGRTRGIRVAAFAAALLTFGYIVSVAVTRTPLGFLARL